MSKIRTLGFVLINIFFTSSIKGEYARLQNDFNAGTDGWILAKNSWQRQPFGNIMQDFPEVWNSLNMSNKEDVENFVLVPFLPQGETEENNLSTMSRDIVLSEGGELEILFSVFLVGWDRTSLQDIRSVNPKLQVFYDEDMVFDLAKAVIDHQDQYQFNSWNQFKMLSLYRDAINITVTMVGSRGTRSPATSLVLLDNIILETRLPNNSIPGVELDTKGRSEPAAEMNMNGGWTKLDTEAEQEAKSEEEEKGRPSFCSLKPESTPCSRFPKKRYFFNETSNACEIFMYECKGNENRFDDLETCQVLCANRQQLQPDPATLRSSEFTSFESGFQDWNQRNWVRLNYSSNEMRRQSVSPPPVVYPEYSNNLIGISPEFHKFDYRKPELQQVFIVKKNMMLIIEFQLLLKSEGSSGFLSFLFQLDPGLQIYAGSTKVFDFDVHGVSDGRWHEYRIRINNTDVEEYMKESGEQNILITINGWLGSGGTGIIVLDNLNVTQISEDITSIGITQVTQGNSPNLEPSNTSVTTPQPVSAHCIEAVDKGSCKGEFSRFYYNQLIGSCVEFLWTGCAGNDNRYISREECESYCIHNVSIPTPTVDRQVPQIACALPGEIGHCDGKIPRFHFSVETGSCEEILYSGCGANSNLFDTRDECQDFCQDVTPKQIPANSSSDCELNYDPGSCTSYKTMYYYSSNSKACLKFNYGGCGGNNNKFSTETECLETCSPAPGSVHGSYPVARPTEKPGFNESYCSLPSDAGNCREDIVRYYYSTFFENCFSFHWTGCGGNMNNFESWSDCWVTCQPEEEDRRMKLTTSQSLSIKEFTTESMDIVRKVEDSSEEADDFSLLPYVRDPDHSPQHVCGMKYDVGPCIPLDPTEYKQRYFHNITSGKCEMFLYGGCGGNHNNFLNVSDCQAFCEPKGNEEMSKSSATASASRGIVVIVNHFNKSSCFVSPRHGYCSGEQLRWYYSRWDNICKPYNYSGCGGNENNFISKDVCEEYCPPIKIDENANRCQKLRSRGNTCTFGVSRFFYDKYSHRCIRFTACPNLPETENNFPDRITCRDTCINHKSEAPTNQPLAETIANKTAAVSNAVVEHTEDIEDVEEGSNGATIVEVIIILVIVGLLSFGGVLIWRRYQNMQFADTYRLFDNNRQENQVRDEPAETNRGYPTVNFENPVYVNDVYDVDRDLDRDVQIPPLTLGNLGSIPEHSAA